MSQSRQYMLQDGIDPINRNGSVYTDAERIFQELIGDLSGTYDESAVSEFEPGDIERSILLELEQADDKDTIERTLKDVGLLPRGRNSP